jgi:DNA-binding IclR family transcriptional regulator
MSSTVDKALGLLKLVATSQTSLGLMEIASAADIDKSTALRLLTTLSKHGFVSRDAQRCYHLGSALFAMTTGFAEQSDLRLLALPHLRNLASTTRETASLHLLIDNARVCIEGVDSPEPIRRQTPLGEVHHLHEGPTGKVILAFLPDNSLKRYQSATGLTSEMLDRIRPQLALIRSQGFLNAIDDRVPGASGLSAPIFKHGEVCASITIAGPKERWTEGRMLAFAPELLAATAGISHELSDKRVGSRGG